VALRIDGVEADEKLLRFKMDEAISGVPLTLSERAMIRSAESIS
jgi:hypothetical protein